MMKVLMTRAGVLMECVECSRQFSSDDPELEAGHDCES